MRKADIMEYGNPATYPLKPRRYVLTAVCLYSTCTCIMYMHVNTCTCMLYMHVLTTLYIHVSDTCMSVHVGIDYTVHTCVRYMYLHVSSCRY